jgi:hypothetical protein
MCLCIFIPFYFVRNLISCLNPGWRTANNAFKFLQIIVPSRIRSGQVLPHCYWPHVFRRPHCKSHHSEGALTIAQQKEYGIHNRKSRLWIKRISEKETEIKVKGKEKKKRGRTRNGSVTNWRICEVMMEDKVGGDKVPHHRTVCSLERFLCQVATFHCPQWVTFKALRLSNLISCVFLTTSTWFTSISNQMWKELSAFRFRPVSIYRWYFVLQSGIHLSPKSQVKIHDPYEHYTGTRFVLYFFPLDIFPFSIILLISCRLFPFVTEMSGLVKLLWIRLRNKVTKRKQEILKWFFFF